MSRTHLTAVEKDGAEVPPWNNIPAYDNSSRMMPFHVERWCNGVSSIFGNPDVVDKATTIALYEHVFVYNQRVMWGQLKTLTNNIDELAATPFDASTWVISTAMGQLLMPSGVYDSGTSPWSEMSRARVSIRHIDDYPARTDYLIIRMFGTDGRLLDCMVIHKELIDNFANRWFALRAWWHVNTARYAPRGTVNNLNGGAHCDKARAANETSIGHVREWCFAFVKAVLCEMGVQRKPTASHLHIAHGLACEVRQTTPVTELLASDPVEWAKREYRHFIST